ncbi:hypothetical protein OSB04_003664 [Centaurea solstitialis]|uniref:Uncharacterized protein n=1 Tax=Centaurea solstitialis TaxID=347529 RepID=A0AA38UCU4_9ASTR|nr:hypothetical protein OSB04_003664 [Centaurea solstitialis]
MDEGSRIWGVEAMMSRSAWWKPVVEKLKAKLSSWKAKIISFGGHVALFKSVIGLFQKEGLIIGSLFSINQRLLGKWLWRFQSKKEAMWVKVIKGIYRYLGGLFCSECSGRRGLLVPTLSKGINFSGSFPKLAYLESNLCPKIVEIRFRSITLGSGGGDEGGNQGGEKWRNRGSKKEAPKVGASKGKWRHVGVGV